MKNQSSISIILFATFAAMLLLSSCTKIFNLSNTTPDESKVLKRPPLSVPPDFHLPPTQENQSSMKNASTHKASANIKLNSTAAHEDLTYSDKTFIKKFRQVKQEKNISPKTQSENNSNIKAVQHPSTTQTKQLTHTQTDAKATQVDHLTVSDKMFIKKLRETEAKTCKMVKTNSSDLQSKKIGQTSKLLK